MDFGFPKPSQNRFKIQLKSISPKACDFSSIFPEKMLCRTSADIDFVVVFQCKMALRDFFFTSLFLCVFGLKNLPKALRKRNPNPSKIDAKNVLFLNIGFLGFGTPFCCLLGLQVGAKSRPKSQIRVEGVDLPSDLKLHDF